MRRIAHLTVLVGFLVLPACAPYHHPLEGLQIKRCSDYVTEAAQLQCQTAVLGLYQSGQNAMFSNWNRALHVEPIQSAPLPVYRPPMGSQAPVTCQFIGQQMFCQ